MRSAENVLQEMKILKEKYGVDELQITDDNFTLNKKRALKIMNGMKEFNFSWCTPQGIAVWVLDNELLEKMKESGCFRIGLGIESANNDVLRKIKKGTKIEQVEETVEMAKQVGIEVVGFFIVGHPTETYERFMETVEFARRMPFGFVNFWNLVPYPGTELLQWVRKNAVLLYSEEVYLNRTSYGEARPIFETADFSAEERKKAYQLGHSLERKSIAYRKMGRFWGRVGLAISSFSILERILVRLIKVNRIGRFLFQALSSRAGKNRAGTGGK